jgi:hypothetical protein
MESYRSAFSFNTQLIEGSGTLWVPSDLGNVRLMII